MKNKLIILIVSTQLLTTQPIFALDDSTEIPPELPSTLQSVRDPLLFELASHVKKNRTWHHSYLSLDYPVLKESGVKLSNKYLSREDFDKYMGNHGISGGDSSVTVKNVEQNKIDIQRLAKINDNKIDGFQFASPVLYGYGDLIPLDVTIHRKTYDISKRMPFINKDAMVLISYTISLNNTKLSLEGRRNNHAQGIINDVKIPLSGTVGNESLYANGVGTFKLKNGLLDVSSAFSFNDYKTENSSIMVLGYSNYVTGF